MEDEVDQESEGSAGDGGAGSTAGELEASTLTTSLAEAAATKRKQERSYR